MRHAYSTGVAMGLSILLAFSGVPRAQARANLLTLAELNELDAGFHKEMDAAQEAFDREAFGDA